MRTEPTKFEDYILRSRKLGQYIEIEKPTETKILIKKIKREVRRDNWHLYIIIAVASILLVLSSISLVSRFVKLIG